MTLLAVGALTARASAQSWSPPFNHNDVHNGSGDYTNPFSPWLHPPTYPFPTVMPAGSAVPNPPEVLVPFGWPQPEAHGRNFNAVHMALIPKGPYRGMVFVMNRSERVIAEWPIGGGTNYVFQCYAIVDPADVTPTNVRYRNFLLPIAAYGPVGGLPTGPAVQDLFCSGHVWSPFGDLIIVGGTDYLPSAGTNYDGGILTFAWNPRLPVGDWLFSTPSVPFYDSTLGLHGLWRQGPDLAQARWYPTAVLTHRLTRARYSDPLLPPPPARERILVLGGIESVWQPPPPGLEARNSYEALVVEAEADATSGLLVDDQTPAAGTLDPIRSWIGCGTSAGADVDWPDEYPRCHLLSSGKVFFSGYAPHAALLDLNDNGAPGSGPGTWTQLPNQPGQPPGTYSSNWQAVRHDGSSVLFPNLGDTLDQVVRLGGADEFAGPTTDAVESVDAGNNGTWVPAPAMQNADGLPDGGRAFLNVVILPTGALLALGGQHQDGASNNTPVYVPLLFENGSWSKQPANPTPSRRTYHSTAVLLPDGRVFVGGGDDRDADYEIFSPPYLDVPANRPVNPAWHTQVPPFDATYGALVLGRDVDYYVDFDRLPFGQTITKAVLMAPCSATHHSDMHQRYVELKTEVNNGNEVHFSCTHGETVVPRGLYMLFFVTNTSVSHAIWVMFQ